MFTGKDEPGPSQESEKSQVTQLANDPAPPDPARIMNQMRKWGCYFDGKDPWAFLERVEELRHSYGYSEAQLLLGLPELLRGDALLWYRNQRDTWTSWKEFERDFRLQYLPRRYRSQLTREIQSRFQKTDEPFAKYATALLTSMRRAGGFSAEDQLERTYENMNPEYKMYIRLDDVTSISELGIRAAEYEAIMLQRRERKTESQARAPTVAAAYTREECCRRCKQRGHTRQHCQRPPRKFCSRCGKDGVLTRDYHPTPGNAIRAGGETITVRPSTPSS